MKRTLKNKIDYSKSIGYSKNFVTLGESKMENTPTPWNRGNLTSMIRDSNGKAIARTTNLEDAALIVRAVNSHEALLEQLKESQRRFLSLLGWLETPEKGPMEMIIKEGMAKIAQAIAKAEGI